MNTEQKVTDTLLDKRLGFSIPTRYLKYIGIKKLRWSIKPLRLGTMIYLSREFMQVKLINGNIDSLMTALEGDIERMCRSIAISILNSKWGIKLLTKPMAAYLKWNMNARELNALVVTVMTQMNLVDFISATALIGNLNVIKAGPQEKGSAIAPGEQSEEL